MKTTYFLCQTGAEPRQVGTTKKAAGEALRDLYKLYLAGGWKLAWGNARDQHYAFSKDGVREAIAIKSPAHMPECEDLDCLGCGRVVSA